MSSSLFIKLSDGEVELMHDCISDIMDSMGDTPMLDPGMPKPKAEWLVSGKYYHPNNSADIAGQAKVTFAKLNKSLNIFGDREWFSGIPSKPLPFLSLPIEYQYAFGSDAYPSNPLGKGFKQNTLANIELANTTVTDNNKPYLPAGFGPLDPSWPQRVRFQGTYDQTYLEKYFPGYPADMDWKLFMSSPEDQWFDGFLNGDEEYILENLHPEHPVLKGKLPGLFPRCFIKDTAEKNTDLQFKEVELHLDTAWFFPDKDIIQLTWRGGMPVLSDEAEQISHLLLGYEQVSDDKKPASHYKNALESRIRTKDPLLTNLNTGDLIPFNTLTAMQLLQQSALADQPESQLANNLECKANSITEAVNEKLAQSIDDLKSQLDAPGIEQSQKDKVNEMLASLESPSKPDNEIQTLLTNIEEILPGINSGSAKDIDLSNFSFTKLDDIFAEIESFIDIKKDQIFDTLKPELEKLKLQLNSSTTLDQLDDAQQEKIQQEINNLEALIQGDEVPKILAPLPRLEIENLQQQLSNAYPEIEKARQELHLLLSNPLISAPEVIQNAKDKIDNLEKTNLSSIEASLIDAKKQFISTYSMAAHYGEIGLSPHNDENTQRNRLLQIIAGDKDASYQDWACLDLSGLNLDGVNFTGCLMEQVNLTGASLISANFENAILARAILSKANCSQSNFNYANLGAATCNNTMFSSSSFKESKFSKTIFDRCDFSSSSFIQPEVLEISINHCDFSFTELENWPFLELEMKGNKFDDAKFISCTVINSKLKDCSFDRASLPSTAWANTSIQDTSFQQADMTSNCFVSSTDIEDDQEACTFVNINFQQTILDKANLQGLDFSNNDFSHSKIASTNFASANLSNCIFNDCLGYQAQFRKAILSGASMKRANLMEAVLSKAIITNTDLESANLYGADFLRATVKGTRFNNANLDATILRDWRPS